MNPVERIFRLLIKVLSQDDADRIRAPIEIAEIYQSILPYRRYKTALEFDTNQDYEMALLRFLAGEGGFASVDPSEAQEALEEEARASHPNPGAFREYAAAKVYLNTRAARTVAPPPEDAYAPPQVRAVHEETTAMKPPFVADTDTAEAEVGGGAATFEQATTPTSNSLDITPPPSPVGSPPFGDLSRERGAPAAKPPLIARRTCRFCGGEFPSDRDVQYCPHCGVNAVAPVCSGCGAELETNWKFCVVCGKRANTDE